MSACKSARTTASDRTEPARIDEYIGIGKSTALVVYFSHLRQKILAVMSESNLNRSYACGFGHGRYEKC